MGQQAADARRDLTRAGKNMRLHLRPQRNIRAHKRDRQSTQPVVSSGHAEITRRTFFLSNHAPLCALKILTQTERFKNP